MKENWPATVEATKKLSKELYSESMKGTEQFVEAVKKK